MRGPRLIRVGTLVIACVSAVWAVSLTLLGGINTSVLGITLRSNNPRRVFLLALLALAGYFLSGGRIRLDSLKRAVAAIWTPAAPLVLAACRRPALITAGIAAALAVTAAAGSTRIAGGSDVYGYVSQADLWLTGELVQQQHWVTEVPWPDAEWTFSPLGYRPAAAHGPGAIVPTYSPGLPLLMAAAKLLGGHCVMFAVVPLFAGLGVLATYGIGSRLGSPPAGLIGAALVAASPAVLVVSFEPLTDVPVMSMWAAAFYLLLRAAAESERRPRLVAFCSGIAVSLAILIRPNLVLLAVPMGLLFFVCRMRTRSLRITLASVFTLGALPGILAVALINAQLYGSPTTSGYGSFSEQFAWSHVGPNLRRYAAWFAYAQTPIAFAGFAALLLPSRRIWPGLADRRTLGIIALFVAILWAQYCAYLEFDSWSYVRFLLPSWPFIMIGLGAMIVALVELTAARRSPLARSALAALLAIGLCTWTLDIASRSDVFGQRQAAAHEASIGQLVRQHTDENSVILAFERSGSIRYYAGRTTMRYDLLPEDWLDGAVEWLTKRGVHVYAVLDPAHREAVRERFAGQRALAALERPVLLYEPNRTALYDLSTPPPPEKSLVLIEGDPGGRAGCDPPAAYTPIGLR